MIVIIKCASTGQQSSVEVPRKESPQVSAEEDRGDRETLPEDVLSVLILKPEWE